MSSGGLKLTDQNIADLINKLVSVGHLRNIVQTTDGAGQYLTSEQIQKEIIQVISEMQNLKMQDLQKRIGVPQDIIMKNLQVVKNLEGADEFHILASHDTVVTEAFMGGEVLSLVKKKLEESGRVNLQNEIAGKFGLPTKFLIDRIMLDKEIFEYPCPDGNGPRNKIQNEVLISKALELEETKANHDQIAKIDEPMSIETICENLGINQNAQSQEKVLSIIKNQSMGKIFQGKLFLPTSYLDKEHKLIIQAFQDQGYVKVSDFDKLYLPKASGSSGLSTEQIIQNLNLTNQDEFLELDHFIIGINQLDKILIEFQKLASDGGTGFLYLPDLESAGILPEDFHNKIEDVNLLIDHLQRRMKLPLSDSHASQSSRSFIQMPDDEFICSRGFIQRYMDHFKEISEQQVIDRIMKGEKPKSRSSQIDSKKVEVASANNKKQKGGKSGKGKSKKNQNAQDQESKNEELQAAAMLAEMIEVVFNDSEIGEHLQKFDPNFAKEEEIQALLLEPLAQFLKIPVNKQFQVIFEEVADRQSTKKNVNQHQDTEKQLEDQIQSMQLAQKCMQNQVLKHFKLDSDKTESKTGYDELVAQISEVMCATGGECDTLLNKLASVQAFHNGIDFQGMKGVTVDKETGLTMIACKQDRDLLSQRFSKHVREIFTELDQLRASGSSTGSGDFLIFMDCLQDNIKNLGCNIRQLDKKSEKALLANLKHQLIEKQDENLAWRLTRIMLTQCNNTCLNLPISGASRKNLDKFIKIQLQFLVNNDYIEEASDLHQNLMNLALLKKVPIAQRFLEGVDQEQRLAEVRAKVDAFRQSQSQAPQEPGVGESWLLVDDPAEESKGPEQDDEAQARPVANEADYFMDILKIIEE